jgi:hypothetical protein
MKGIKMETNEILEERGSRYGSFDTNAQISQELKALMRETPSWDNLKTYQKEALEMIQHKISRILNGDVMYEDNWIDIIGYCQLALDQLRRDIEFQRTPNLFEGEEDVN